MGWMPAVAAVVALVCQMMLLVGFFRRHAQQHRRPHRLMRAHPLVGTPAAVPLVLSIPGALLVLAATAVSFILGLGLVVGLVAAAAANCASEFRIDRNR